MKTLLLMRHAKSSWKDSELDDHDRGLNGRGKKDAPRMGELLKEQNLLPDYVVTSSARRARKTADHVALASGYRGECRLTGELYMAGPDKFLEVIRQTPDSCERLLLIGHNPGLEEFFEQLTGTYTPLPTAAVARLELDLDSWQNLTPESNAELIRLWQPRELA
ncbi:MAG TPA: histidine phosphatase family protein [Pirellulaceae bacterium]|nr:histidine phosphatase family protein [Pirellulaceae bacterium]